MSENNSQSYISHHLHFLQIDLRDMSVVDSVKPVSKEDLELCVNQTSNLNQCLTTVKTENCKITDLGSGVCYASHTDCKSLYFKPRFTWINCYSWLFVFNLIQICFKENYKWSSNQTSMFS